MVKRKKPARNVRKEKTVVEKRFKDFGEEVEDIGNRFGRHMERRGRAWERRGCEFDNSFSKTFGVLGPLITSVIGIIIMVLLTWVMSFINNNVQSWLLNDINAFLTSNIGVLFMLMLFFSYTSHFSKVNYRLYRIFSPVSVAVGIATCFWIGAHALQIMNTTLNIPFISSLVSYIGQSIFLVFWLFLCVGYIVLAIIIATEKTLYHQEERVVKRTKPVKAQNMEEVHRLYRSCKDKILGGVCGGIAEYLGIDPTIVRILWIIGTLAWGFGILLYIVLWIIVPRNPYQKCR
ncbi:MAG: PspC domain-containing protein [Candidatus Aenigmatarchaeota archaeon]